MKVLLKGYYGFGNLGDDILLMVSAAVIKNIYQDSELYVFSNNTENNPDSLCDNNFNKYVYNLIGSDILLIDWTYKGSFDLIFHGGGGTYFDYSKGGFLSKMLVSLLNSFSAVRVARFDSFLRFILKKNPNISTPCRIGFGLGIGPLNGLPNKHYRIMCELADYKAILVRDTNSLNCLDHINVKGMNKSYTDIAFLDHLWRRDLVRTGNKEGKRVGVVLMDWHLNSDVYINNLMIFADRLRKSVCEVSFLSFDSNHDQVYAEEVRRRGWELSQWNPLEMDIHDFMSKIAEQNVIVTARAHGAILGGCLGVPSVCLAINPKLVEVYKMFPSSAKLIMPPFEPEEVYNNVIDMLDNKNMYSKWLADDMDRNRLLAKSSLDDLHRILGSKSHQ